MTDARHQDLVIGLDEGAYRPSPRLRLQWTCQGGVAWRTGTRLLIVVASVLLCGASTRAQTTARAAARDPFAALATTVDTAARQAHVSDPPATLVFTNRPIVQFRATVLARPPVVRVAAAVDLLNALVTQAPDARVSIHAYGEARMVALGDRPAFVIFPADVDPLAGQTAAGQAEEAAARLRVAFREAVELRTPSRWLSGIAFALGTTALYALLVWGLVRMDRWLSRAASRAAERRLGLMAVGDLMFSVRAPIIVRRLLGWTGVVIAVLLTYAWLAALLRTFPYTRPWGESLRGALLTALAGAGRSLLDQLPNLLTVLAIVLVTRFLIRIAGLAFDAVEQGRLSIAWIHPETTSSTRRIVVSLLWLFALILSYKYLPGSDSDIFKGVSVFIGLIVSLGSSGLMNQAMSGMVLTYSRALRLGDYVRIGEVEGTVIHLGTLSTKVRTPRNEEITIPNAVMTSTATTNFSRNAEHEGVLAATSVTIGYDTPWRQVHALLLRAAEQASGVRRQPLPAVLQTQLGDHYVHYTLLVCLENPARRLVALTNLHASIQDAFNEFGVQIMSPHYEADPEEPKVVPPSRWYTEPAVGPGRPAAAPGTADPVGGV